MQIKKEIWRHALLWLSIAVYASTQIHLGYVRDIPDFLIELAVLTSCLSLLIEISRLKLGWLMMLGWGLYGTSLLVDIIDEYFIPNEWATYLDTVDDVLKLGVVFIGLSFYNVIKEKKWLINSLQLEVEYRRELEEQLNDVACLDELTQIGNRRAFFQDYPELIEQYQHPKLVFIDIDNFKQLNDTQGHQEGDELLKQFAFCLMEQCAERGKPYRFGGDEFVILYDAVDCDQLVAHINKQMHDIFIQTKVSISHGTIAVDEQASADAQILKVDELMYKNKQERKSMRQAERLLT